MIFFPYFVRTIVINSSHILRIVWTSASREICQKPCTSIVECSSFPILLNYCENSQAEEIAWDFINSKFLRESWTWEASVFFSTCSVICELNHPKDWELYCISAWHEICKKPMFIWNFGLFVFSQTFPVTSEFIQRMFWELHGFLLHVKK